MAFETAAPIPGGSVELRRRQRQFIDLRNRQPEAPSYELEPGAATGTIPEIEAGSLDARLIRRSLSESASLIVRGMLSPAVTERLRSDIETVLEALARVGPHGDSRDGWYEPFVGAESSPELDLSRRIATMSDMGALLVDSPHFSGHYLDLLQRLNVIDLVESYLEAPPVFSAEKAVLRRVPPSTGTNWHQDGAFLGSEVRSLNLWISLSDCGTDAPGLDLVAKRPSQILPTGTPGALFDWSISDSAVDEWRGDAPVIHPEFRAGDAIFFDHMNVHRTGVRPGMSSSRYALECWFFSPWYFPSGYTGIAARMPADE